MRILMLINRKAAGYNEDLVKRCRNLITKRGTNVDMLYPKDINELKHVLEKACGHYDLLLIGGGDGTVGLVTNLVRCDVAISIIPMGRGNTFYRSVFSDTDPCKLLNDLFKGSKVIKVDVGYVAEINRLFVLGATVGFIPEVIRSSEKYKVLGGRTAYALAALERIIAGLKSSKCRVEAENAKVFEGPLSMISLGIVKYRAGRFKLFPDADINDGLIDYLIVPKLSRLRALKLLRDSTKGTHVSFDIIYNKATKVELSCEDPLLLEVDGDVLGSYSRLKFGIKPSFMSLLVPS